jgi:hypothetical protein
VYFSEASTNEQGQVIRDYNYEMDTGFEGVQNATDLWTWSLLMRFLRKDIRVGGALGTCCFYYQLTSSWFHHAGTVFLLAQLIGVNFTIKDSSSHIYEPLTYCSILGKHSQH